MKDSTQLIIKEGGQKERNGIARMPLNSKRGNKGKVICSGSISAFISRRENFSTTDAGQLPARDALQAAAEELSEVVGRALRSPIHHHPVRSEQKSTRFTHQSLKPRLTFYAFVSDCSTS